VELLKRTTITEWQEVSQHFIDMVALTSSIVVLNAL